MVPPATHHTFVCLSLNHYIHRLPSGGDQAVVVASRSKVYHHRGAAIRALSHSIGQINTQRSDLTIASILAFMSMEVSPAFWLFLHLKFARLLIVIGSSKTLHARTGAHMRVVCNDSSICVAGSGLC